jgi:hypothetical protein
LLQYLSGCSTMPSNPFFSAVRRRVDEDPPRNAWYRAYPLKEGQRNCQPRSARPGVSVPWTTADRYSAEDIWQRDLSAYLNDKEKAAHDKAAGEVLGDPEKTIKTLVTKLTTGAPKAFGRDVDGKPASQVLEERLRAMLRPELVLMAAVLLKAPVSAWLAVVHEEE